MVTRRPWRLGVDLLGLLGVALAIVIWWALTFVVSTTALPPPGAVLNRIANDFLIADQLSYYGLPETGLLGSMLYTATNVLIAVVAGSLIGTVLGLITARVPDRPCRARSDPQHHRHDPDPGDGAVLPHLVRRRRLERATARHPLRR